VTRAAGNLAWDRWAVGLRDFPIGRPVCRPPGCLELSRHQNWVRWSVPDRGLAGPVGEAPGLAAPAGSVQHLSISVSCPMGLP